MQLSAMDCNSRSNNIERESDLGDDMSQVASDRSDDDIRDCDSTDGDNQLSSKKTPICLNRSINNNGGNVYFNDCGSTGELSPIQQAETELRHHQLLPNHPLNTLGSFMGIGGLHNISNLQHSDVLEKLKMQVRDMKVGLMDQDYAAATHGLVFGANVNQGFSLPPPAISSSYGHSATNMAPPQTANNANNLNANCGNGSPFNVSNGVGVNNSAQNAFSFTSPIAPTAKEGANSASNSSTSSETSNSSQQNNGWSFEEQYKQVRQLYEINDDPKRKEFLDDLFSFMQKRGSPINRLPIMAKSVLDLYELYNLVIARGGLVDVINKKLWQEIIKGLHLPSSITSAAFTLRTQYMKYLYPYECEKKNLSTPAELQAAIDGNRREGRRSSYGQYEAIHSQIPMNQMQRPPLPAGIQQMSPLALVTHAAAANNQQAQAAAAAAAAHRRLMGPTFGQMPNLVTQEIENRMMEYLQLMQAKKEQNLVNGSSSSGASVESPHQQQRQRSQSPEISTHDALSALKMSHVALWQMYHNSKSPPASVNTSPQCRNSTEHQRNEALNLSESPPNITIKREREREHSPETTDENQQHQPPPSKRISNASVPGTAFPGNFYLNPHNMAAAAAAATFSQSQDNQLDVSSEMEDDYEGGEHNASENKSTSCLRDGREHPPSNGHLDKSDDSAIENSPSASSAGNRHSSPLTTKKKVNSKDLKSEATTETKTLPYDTINLLSGMQFHVTRIGTSDNGEQQLTVTLDLNGTKFTGVLVANVDNASNKSLNAAEKQQQSSEKLSVANPSRDESTCDTADMRQNVADEAIDDILTTKPDANETVKGDGIHSP